MSGTVADLSLGDLRRALEGGAASSVDATEACLERIAAHDDQLGCFLRLDEDGALEQAAASDARRSRGEARGPLDGVPVALKDNLVTEGLITTGGSRILEGWIPPYDGTVVRRLRDAGAVIVGKLNCDEFGMGSSNENSAYRPCRNPWDLERSPGGSSGGAAAAVAAGMCFGALGTDTGGSIRQPAAFCGVAGLKPTYGRVSRFGVIAFASSLDQVGPLTRDVEGAALMLSAIAGHDERDATSLTQDVPDYAASLGGDLAGLKLGVIEECAAVEGVEPSVQAATERASAALVARGATVKTVSVPRLPHAVATYYVVATAEASSNLARLDGVRYGPRRGDGGGLEALYEETRGELFGDEVKRRILLGTYVLSAGYYDAYYRKAQQVRALLADDLRRAFDDVDLLLVPTAPTPAFKLGAKTADPLEMYLSDIFTIPPSLAGLCGLSVNAGFSDEELPIGVQLVGRPLDEGRLLRVGHALEQELGLVERRPPRTQAPLPETETS